MDADQIYYANQSASQFLEEHASEELYDRIMNEYSGNLHRLPAELVAEVATATHTHPATLATEYGLGKMLPLAEIESLAHQWDGSRIGPLHQLA